MARPVLLVHGGLGEAKDAERFWCRPGIVAGIRAAGFDVTAPDLDTCPSSRAAAADTLAAGMSESASVVAGSNAVSVAVRLAIEHPPLVGLLVLLWPATCGDPIVDAAAPSEVNHLLAGETLRGVTDDEFATLDQPTAVMASDPPNRFPCRANRDPACGAHRRGDPERGRVPGVATPRVRTGL